MNSEVFSPEDLESGRLLFAQAWRFSRGTPDLDHLPPADRPEVTFAGRSNVGKSSLINALVGQSGLARASNTPGRTKELNFFEPPAGTFYIVDMPGYGFAEAPKQQIAAWTKVLRGYLAGRQSLIRAFVLIDARHGLKPSDLEMMTLLDQAAVSYQIVLTKADKVKNSDLATVTADCTKALSKHPAAYPELVATSAETGLGIAELRAGIAQLISRA